MFRIRSVFAFAVLTGSILATFLTPKPVQAQSDPFDIYVNDSRDLDDLNPADATCDADIASDDQCTLRAAISTANAYKGDDSPVWIHLPPGEYLLDIPKSGTDSSAKGDFDIYYPKADVVIEGMDPQNPSFIDGNQIDRVFDISGPNTLNVNLYNLIITNGVVYNDIDYAEGGGGIRNFANLTLDNVSIENNMVSCTPPTGCTGSVGGGILNIGHITNSTISGNSDTNSTGGIFMSSAELKMANVTLAGNRSNSWLGSNLYSNFTIQARNSIIADPDPGKANCQITPGPMISQGYNISSDASCVFTGTGDLVYTDPRLSILADWGGATFTRALLAGSPAINAGNPAGCKSFLFDVDLSYDQRGQPRFPGRCDIGAFEGAIYPVYLPAVRR